MEDSRSISLITARNEYQKYLVYLLYPCIYQGMKYMWDNAKERSVPNRVYQEFQERCKLVRKWNNDIIENEYNRIIKKTGCSWLEDLINHVFLLNTEILAAYHPQGGRPNVRLKLPKGEKFVHHCYQECAKEFYQDVQLMEDRIEVKSKLDQARNLKKANQLIKSCIEQTITNMLPIENIIRQKDSEAEDAIPMGNLFVFAPHAQAPSSPQPPQSFAPSPEPPVMEAVVQPHIESPPEPVQQMNEIGSDFNPDSLFDADIPKKVEEPNNLHHFDQQEDIRKPEIEENSPEDVKIIHLDQSGYKRRGSSSRKSSSDVESQDNKSDIEIKESGGPSQELPTVREKRDAYNINLDVLSNDVDLKHAVDGVQEADVESKQQVPPLTSFDAMNFFDD